MRHFLFVLGGGALVALFACGESFSSNSGDAGGGGTSSTSTDHGPSATNATTSTGGSSATSTGGNASTVSTGGAMSSVSTGGASATTDVTSTGGSTSSGPPQNEDCFNGKDDNGNGQIDCSDPMCNATASCKPKSPMLPGGPYIVSFGTNQTMPAACPSDFSIVADYAELPDTIPPPKCACSCGTSDACALSVTLSDESGMGCDGSVQLTVDPGACVGNPDADPTTYGVRGQIVAASTPSCASSQDGTIPAIGETYLRVCDSSAGGCKATDKCVPSSLAGFEICVLASADQACPPEYPKKHTIYDPSSIQDTRKCTDTCACAYKSDADCDGKVDTYSDAKCTLLSDQQDVGDCMQSLGTVAVSIGYEPNDAGSCTPVGGGVYTGSVTTMNPSTLCCQ